MKSLRLFLFALLLGSSARAAERPKLIVAVLVDQLRYDYLERFHDQFVEGGFRRLTDHGAFMTFARYNYCPTITGPGHASFFSGTTPSMHGIIANDWFDRRTLKSVYCVGDSSVTGVGTTGPAGKMSPRNFIGANFSDMMRLHYRSKVVGISMKDRGAILPAGRNPTGAYWWESSSGNFVTSSWYRKDLPEWVKQFNARQRAKDFIGQKWERLNDPKTYAWPDVGPGEGPLSGEKTVTFPHVVKAALSAAPTVTPGPATPAPGKTVAASEAAATGKAETFENIMPTPFGNQLLAEFARAAVEGENLGAGPQPDVFTVSFSSIDYCGHRFGPYSQEVQDCVLRLDRELAGLFGWLDQRLGADNYAVVLTADHGVAPTPEFGNEQGFDGIRSDQVELMKDLLAKLSERFGPAKYLLTTRFVEGNLFLNPETLKEKSLSIATVGDFIRDWALSTGKFQAVYTRDQLLDGRAPGLLGERVLNGFNAERSGDVVLIYKPYTISWGSTGTTHGSPWSYDTHVPIIFQGTPFKAGRYADEFYITDIVATLCAAMHIDEPPASFGKPMVKLLVDP